MEKQNRLKLTALTNDFTKIALYLFMIIKVLLDSLLKVQAPAKSSNVRNVHNVLCFIEDYASVVCPLRYQNIQQPALMWNKNIIK